uniref:Nicastrin n=1 Tax=Chenopodium quinoa TaxID=63459 RepID=A0A803MZ88_CHEQI
MLLLSLTNSNPSMASYYKYSCLLICFLAQFSVSFSGQSNSLDSVPDLERSMYKVIDGFPCVRLLNLSGEIGCANPGRDKVVAPVVRYRDGVVIHQLSTILLSVDAVQSFFNRVATDADFGRNIGGVLVEAESNKEKLKGFSPDEKFPQSKFSPYKNLTYEWNPNVATKNEKNNRSYSQDVAEFDLVMQGSVWSSLPPIIQSSLDVTKPIILAMGTMDSASFFRDKGLGADSPLSGLVALLAAADALSHSDYLKSFKKQLVFLVLTGETWGFLGSRRFLHELDLQSDAVAGLNDTFIETVLEIGSVGKGFNGGVKNFFVHSSSRTKVANEMFEALQSAQVSLKSDNIKISAANILNPGVPPSSLMSFLNKDSKISGVVLEDFDDMFANGFYHSHLDDISNINSTSIVAAASLVARSLYILATDMQNTKIPDLDSISVNASLVDELLDCLLKCDPGLSCGLVKNYILPTGACPSSYVGVIVTDPSSPPYRGYSSDISRFIWNFLAEKTAMKMENTSLNCQQGCRSESEVCIKAETDNIGVCVKSTTRYVPAFSTRLQYESGSWKLLPPNSTDPMSMADPVWTESNWDVIGLRVYTRQNAAYDRLILLIGLGITGFSYLAIEIFKTIVTKTLKRD